MAAGKAFQFEWGSGVIEEEAQAEGKYHMPTIQLLRYTEGSAPGAMSLRFCHYSPTGRFGRPPLMISEDEIDLLRDAVRKTPKLRALLKRIVE